MWTSFSLNEIRNPSSEFFYKTLLTFFPTTPSIITLGWPEPCCNNRTRVHETACNYLVNEPFLYQRGCDLRRAKSRTRTGQDPRQDADPENSEWTIQGMVQQNY
jgi:hypothetical protein